MRKSREKIEEGGCYYHLMNRVAGGKDEYPLGETEREKGMQLVFGLTEYYLLEFISMCWMGNHYHIVLYAPRRDELPDNTALAIRHNAYYSFPGRNKANLIDPNDESACEKVGEKMRDISHFMQIFQQSFSTYYNRTHNRRGRFWADRFKSTIAEGRDALRTVVNYVEINPVRAQLTEDSAEYRHCSWGWFNGSGKHPFASGFLKHMRSSIGNKVTLGWSDKRLMDEFRSEIARAIAYEQGALLHERDLAAKKAKKGETMPVRYLRRMRHISDGGIIGSKLFVQETASRFREKSKVMKKKFSHGKTSEGIDLYCYKQLRLMSE